MATYYGDLWSIELPDEWDVLIREDHVEVRIPHSDAYLRFTPVEFPNAVDAATWVSAASEFNRIRGRPPEKAIVGDFTGSKTEFEVGTDSFKGWALASQHVALDVTYKCTASADARPGAIAEIALQSLRYRGTSAV